MKKLFFLVISVYLFDTCASDNPGVGDIMAIHCLVGLKSLSNQKQTPKVIVIDPSDVESLCAIHTLHCLKKRMESGYVGRMSFQLKRLSGQDKPTEIGKKFPCKKCHRKFDTLRAVCGHQRMHT